jgi:hypothetical protein
VPAVYFAVATFVPEQCAGRACESTLKISKGEHIRDASVRASGFAVAALVQNMRGSGRRILFVHHPRRGATADWRQKPMKTIRAPHIRVPELDLLLFKCGRGFGEADGCAVADSLCRSMHSLVKGVRPLPRCTRSEMGSCYERVPLDLDRP